MYLLWSWWHLHLPCPLPSIASLAACCSSRFMRVLKSSGLGGATRLGVAIWAYIGFLLGSRLFSRLPDLRLDDLLCRLLRSTKSKTNSMFNNCRGDVCYGYNIHTGPLEPKTQLWGIALLGVIFQRVVCIVLSQVWRCMTVFRNTIILQWLHSF